MSEKLLIDVHKMNGEIVQLEQETELRELKLAE